MKRANRRDFHLAASNQVGSATRIKPCGDLWRKDGQFEPRLVQITL